MNLVKYPQLEVAFSMGFLFGRSHQLSFLLHVPAPKRLCLVEFRQHHIPFTSTGLSEDTTRRQLHIF
jgi:hypothetical protein